MKANQRLIIISAAFALIPLLATASIADTLRDENIASLIREDFDSRRGCYLQRGGCNLYEEESPATIEGLNMGQCPGGGSEPLTLTLPATMSYDDTGNTAYYCARLKSYWVLHTQGAFVGSISHWQGPYRLARHGAPAPNTKKIPAPVKPPPLNLEAAPIEKRP